MEYPMLVSAGLESLTGLQVLEGRFDRLLEAVTIHEIAHEWWYAVVAFNEAEEPWLDEGITDYSTVRLMELTYGPNDTIVQLGGAKLDYLQMRRMEYIADPLVPMYGKAWDFDQMGYGVGAYSKPALALSTLENVIGEESMLKIMSTFFEQYKFSHPTTQDFRSVAEDVAGKKLDWFFDGLVYGDDVLNYTVTHVDQNSFTVQRQGELIIPTEVEVTLEDGSVEVIPWDGAKEAATFNDPWNAPIHQVVIDPQQKILVDLQWSDNGLSRRLDASSWLTVNARILYQIQNFLLGEGGL
jgi:aminopeptidase N